MIRSFDLLKVRRVKHVDCKRELAGKLTQWGAPRRNASESWPASSPNGERRGAGNRLSSSVTTDVKPTDWEQSKEGAMQPVPTRV